MPRPLQTPIGLAVASTAKALNRAFDRALVEAGGSLPMWLVLTSVKSAAHGTQRSIAAEIGIEGATLTHHLNKMEQAGLVTRTRDVNNRRIQQVELTEEGEGLFFFLLKTVQEFDRRVRAGFSNAEVQQLRGLLARLDANVAAAMPVTERGRAVNATMSFQLSQRARKVALTAHILSSVGWFGIAVVVAFSGVAAAATSDHVLADALHRTMESAPWLSVPVGLLAVGSGVLLGLGTSYGLIRYRWVVAKIVIAIAVIVTDAVVVHAVARHAVTTGDASAPLYGSTIAHVVMLGVATVLSVYKPRRRTRWGDQSRMQLRANLSDPVGH